VEKIHPFFLVHFVLALLSEEGYHQICLPSAAHLCWLLRVNFRLDRRFPLAG
jgi:hypothetical protein